MKNIAALFIIQLSLVNALSSLDPLPLKPLHKGNSKSKSAKITRKGTTLVGNENSRRRFNQQLVLSSICGFSFRCDASEGSGLVSESSHFHSAGSKDVGYMTLSLPVPTFDCSIPVALWFPVKDGDGTSTDTISSQVRYQHRISVKRIGQMLAGWDFIPDFVSRNFAFEPSINILSSSMKNPKGCKVVFIAHGYLGSRFDLSHIAEELKSLGFVCISPEYPESLAASYARKEGLDRGVINQHLLSYVETNFQPSAYAGIGHSLGCGTILRLGDDSWTRVLIAGRPPEPSSSPLLFISSTNDCTVRFGGSLQIPNGYSILSESKLPLNQIPRHSALIFDRPDGPNHISYLSESVNEAMISFLSPLLPVARFFSIPVLDFDKYQDSRDSKATAASVQPLICHFLAQHTNSRTSSSKGR